jgi:hypothetical protein
VPSPTTSSKAPAKAKATVKLTFKTKRLKAGQRSSVTVRVSVKSVAKPTGRIKVSWGKRSASLSLKAAAKGKATIRSPKLTKGSYKVTATYTPTGSAAKVALTSKSTGYRLTVK